MIGSVVGPAPYPALVRDLQRVIGDEARAQMLEREGRLPARVIACVGGGSNAIGIFTAFLDDEQVELIGVEAGGEGIDTARHGAPLTVGGRAGHPARRALGGDAGRGGADPRGALDLRRPRLPGRRPPARLPARQRPRALRGGHRRRGARGVPRGRARWRGSSRRSRPPTRSPGCSRSPTASSTSCACPGAATRTSPRCSREGKRVSDRRGDRASSGSPGAFAAQRQARRADALPDGRLPDARRSRSRIGEACVQAGADLLELGVPYSDPLADGPVIHAAGTRALAAGSDLGGVLEVARALSPSVPVVLMCYANMVFAPGRRGVRRAPRSATRRVRADRARPAARGGARGARGVRRARHRARAARRADDHARAARARSARARAASSTRSRSSAPPASARRSPTASPRSWRAREASTEVPVALGFGISTPEQARAGGRRGRRRRDRGHAARARGRRVRGPRPRRWASSSPNSRPGLSRRPLGLRAHGTDPHRHRGARRLDRAVGARSARASTRSCSPR